MELTVRAATVYRVPYPMRRPFAASHQEVSDRDVIVVRIDTDSGPGWSECPVLPAAGYANETTDGEISALAGTVLPMLLAIGPVTAEEWAARAPDTGAHAPSRAAVEVALLDAQCRADGVSLATRLGMAAADVPAGAAVGLGSAGDVAREVAALIEDGYGRIKVKISPASAPEVLAAVRSVGGMSLDLQADANGAYEAPQVDLVRALDGLGLTSLEQPFSPGDLAAHAAAASSMSTPICLDESIGSVRDVRDAAAARAGRIVSLKWSRLGGVLATVRLAEECVHLGLAVTIGGMLSSGLGRAVDLALAAMPAVTVTGDQSGSSRYADFDLTEPLVVAGGRIVVPRGPGLGLEVDVDRIEATATDRRRITARG